MAGGGAGRVPSLMTAAVESEASESFFFSLSLACRPRGFRLEPERNEVCINPSFARVWYDVFSRICLAGLSILLHNAKFILVYSRVLRDV